MYSSIVLEWYCGLGPGAVLCPEPGKVPNGTVDRERVFRFGMWIDLQYVQ